MDCTVILDNDGAGDAGDNDNWNRDGRRRRLRSLGDNGDDRSRSSGRVKSRGRGERLLWSADKFCGACRRDSSIVVKECAVLTHSNMRREVKDFERLAFARDKVVSLEGSLAESRRRREG